MLLAARNAVFLGLGLVLAACQNAPDSEIVTADTAENFAGISADEVLHFTGNEPFWGGEVSGTTLRYSTPENIDGQTIAVRRFAGLNGLGLSGTLGDVSFDMAVTPGECDDSMADRAYPYTVTLRLGDETRIGCGWTDANPYTGDENP